MSGCQRRPRGRRWRFRRRPPAQSPRQPLRPRAAPSLPLVECFFFQAGGQGIKAAQFHDFLPGERPGT